MRSIGRRLNPRANQVIVLGHAVKTSSRESESELKERKTVTHNSVFAAHRLQCRMTIRKIDIRHFVCSNLLQITKETMTNFYRHKPLFSLQRSCEIYA